MGKSRLQRWSVMFCGLIVALACGADAQQHRHVKIAGGAVPRPLPPAAPGGLLVGVHDRAVRRAQQGLAARLIVGGTDAFKVLDREHANILAQIAASVRPPATQPHRRRTMWCR